jgi:hypothetical protein
MYNALMSLATQCLHYTNTQTQFVEVQDAYDKMAGRKRCAGTSFVQPSVSFEEELKQAVEDGIAAEADIDPKVLAAEARKGAEDRKLRELRYCSYYSTTGNMQV